MLGLKQSMPSQDSPGTVKVTMPSRVVLEQNMALLDMALSLECKYNKLQFGIRISSIEVSKQ